IAVAREQLGEARALLAESNELASSSDVSGDWAIEPTWVCLEIVEGDSRAATSRASALLVRLEPEEREERWSWMFVQLLAAALHAVGAVEPAVPLYAASEQWYAHRGMSPRMRMPPSLYARLYGGLGVALAGSETTVAELELEEAVALGLAAAARVAEQE